jgi:transcriptional regulator with XRE-family HTH domain
MNLSHEKLSKLRRADEHFDAKYGAPGTESRTQFEAQAKAWYYMEILKQARKRERLTQKQLADRIGKNREYVALLERGETDMQLSTFLNLSDALGLSFALMSDSTQSHKVTVGTEQTNVSAVPSVLSVRATAPKFEPSI